MEKVEMTKENALARIVGLLRRPKLAGFIFLACLIITA